MSWYMGNTPSVIHDKPLQHGGTRMGLLNQREGYGAGTYGGLYADEVKVTTLADSGAGSLDAAISAGTPAWITFNPGMTAPARGTWPAPDNNAPLGAYNAANIHAKSNYTVTSAATTIDGRGGQYGVEGFGFTFNHGNVILHNFRVDFSQWWAGGSELQNAHSGGLYNLNDVDAAYSHGLQPIQKTYLGKIYRGAWSSGTTYPNNDVVTFNGVGYHSLAGSNTNHQPNTSPTWWAAAVPSTTSGAVGGTDYGLWMGTWSSGTTYQLGDGVYYPTTGLVYTSKIDSNLNHLPTSTANWTTFDPVNSPWSSTTTYAQGDSVIGGTGTSAVLYISLVAGNLNHDPTSTTGFWTKIGSGAATTGTVNGQIYCNTNANLNPPTGVDTGLYEMGFWFDHNTFQGPANGVGAPTKGLTWFDFNDGGFALCYGNHHVTYSWNYFADVNKSSIIGCNSTDTMYAGDWVSLSHNWFQRGFQRQPLARFRHIHIWGNYYDQDWSAQSPAAPGNQGVQMIVGESNAQILYEGNLGNASLALPNDLTLARTGGTIIKGKTNGNVVTGSMTLANDTTGTLDSDLATPPYSYSLPALATLANQNAFKTLMLTAGQH